jgi:hypothetical protein
VCELQIPLRLHRLAHAVRDHGRIVVHREEQAKLAVLNSLSSIDAQRGCRHAIAEYTSNLGIWRRAPSISASARCGASLKHPIAVCSADLAADIRRVKGIKKDGVRLGNWLRSSPNERNVDMSEKDSSGLLPHYALSGT